MPMNYREDRVDRTQLEQILKEELSGQEDSCGRGQWTLDHCLRTARLAVALRREIGLPPELDNLIYTAGLFHDVAHDSTDHALHGQAGAERTANLPSGLLPPEFLTKVTDIITFHDDRRLEDGRGDALHLVQDADLLDHLGTLRIWAEFGYAAKHGMHMDEALEKLRHCCRRREFYTSLLHSEPARRELDCRLDFEAAFLKQAETESRGELSR